MTLYVIDEDEWYPVAVPRRVTKHGRKPDKYNPHVKIPDDLMAEWKRVKREFDAIQKKFWRLEDKASAKLPEPDRSRWLNATSMMVGYLPAIASAGVWNEPLMPYHRIPEPTDG